MSETAITIAFIYALFSLALCGIAALDSENGPAVHRRRMARFALTCWAWPLWALWGIWRLLAYLVRTAR